MNILSRINLAMRVLTRGGIGEVVEHFRRAGKLGDSARIDDPYQHVVAVFACVNTIASRLASMPFCVSTQDDRIIETGPIADLLDSPNASMSIEEWWFQTVGWYLLSGRVHWVFESRVRRRPLSAVPVGAPQMRPITDGMQRGTGQVTGWLYRRPGQRWDQAEPLDLDQVWTIRNPSFDADRPASGLSPADVVRRAIAQVLKSEIANEASLDNGVEPGGVLMHKNGEVSDSQRRHLRDELTERHAGPRNRRRPLLLFGEWDWKQISSTFKDMEFKELKLISRGEICAAFGLQQAAVFEPHNSSNSEFFDKAIESMWTGTVIPLAKRLAGEFDRGILRSFEQDTSLRMRSSMREALAPKHTAMMLRRAGRSRRRLYAWFDASAIDAVKDLMAKRVETASRYVSDLFETPAHAGALLDLGLSDNPAQTQPWVPVNKMPFDGLDQLEQPEDEDPEIPEDDPPADPLDRQALPDHIRRLSASQLDRIQDSWWRSWQGLRRQLERKISGHFGRLRREMLDNLQRLEIRSVVIRRDLVAEILFDIARANEDLLRVAGPILREAFQFGGDQIRKQRADADGVSIEDIEAFDLADPQVVDAIRSRTNRIKGIDDTLFRRLSSRLSDMTEQGDTIEQMREMVREQFNIASNRARTIAQTEVGAAVEKANHLGRQQAGVPGKSWISSRKAAARANHLSVERTTISEPIGVDERFRVPPSDRTPGGSALHPRDGSLPAGEVVNCTCTVISRFPGDGVRDANLINALVKRGWMTYPQKQSPVKPEPMS